MSKKRLASMTTSTASFMVLTPSCSRRSEPCFSPILVMASLPTFCPSYPRSSAARIISSRMTPVPALAAFHLYHVGPGSPSFIAHRARNRGSLGRPYTLSHFIMERPFLCLRLRTSIIPVLQRRHGETAPGRRQPADCSARPDVGPLSVSPEGPRWRIISAVCSAWQEGAMRTVRTGEVTEPGRSPYRRLRETCGSLYGYAEALAERLLTPRPTYETIRWEEALADLEARFGNAAEILKEPALRDVEAGTRRLLADIRPEDP